MTIYAVVVLLFFGLVRQPGGQLGVLDVAWPARWSRITEEQAAHYMRQAREAMQQQDMQAALLNLASAAEVHPGNYEVRLSLAQLYGRLSALASAEREFGRMLEDFPARRDMTAVAWHDALVLTRQFPSLARLAAVRLVDPRTTEKSAWLRALFVALKASAQPLDVLRSIDEGLASVPELWRRALIAEARVRSGDRGALREWPTVPLMREHLPLLLAYGESVVDFEPAERAAEEVLRMKPALGAFESERLIYRLHARERNARSALQSFDRMLRLAGRAFERDRMLAVLVEFPDAACVGRIASVAVNPQTPFSPAELAGLWVAAALVGDAPARTIAWDRLRREPTSSTLQAPPVDFSPLNAAVWMRLLPLEREVIEALALKLQAASRAKRT